MAKRIAPLSSRAQIVAKAPEERPPSGSAGPTGSRTALRRRRPEPPRKPKRSFWRGVWIVFQIGLLIFIIGGSVVSFIIYQKGLEFYAKAKNYDLKKLDDLNVTSTFYDINGEELGRIFVEDRIELKSQDIPENMRRAAMAAEDRRYYSHGAIDYWGILRAIHENLGKKSRAAQGGSTIEQQLAKHLIGDFSRTMDRKFLEAFVAIRLENALTKDQIMSYYLNTIYFGKGYFGIGSAARGYFGKEAKDMTVPECALLAGVIRAPNILNNSSPKYDPSLAKWRRDATLRQMMEQGWISQSEYIKDLSVPVNIQPAKPTGQQTFVMVAAVKEMEQILAIEGTDEMPQGLSVQTNIDLHVQRAIEDQINLKLTEIEAQTASPNAGMDPSAPVKGPLQGSAIVADVDTGRIRAWVGGRDFSKSQYDHISMARRENGALLQPLLYTLAFDRLNLTPASMINASYIDPTAPANAADLGLGNPQTDLTKWFLSVQDALALGNKAAATRVGLQISGKGFTDWLKTAGIEDKVPNDKPNIFNPDPITLGDVSSLYQILANDGVKRKLRLIQSIKSRTGEVLYDDSKPEKSSKPETLLNNLDDAQMTLTLQNALRSGSARALSRDYGFKSGLAGMAGYSEGYRDAWFVGYTPKVLAGLWVGYDDSRPIGGKDVAVRSAVPLWGDIMRQVQARLPSGGPFVAPAELSKVEIDRSTGALRGLAGLAPAPGDIFVWLKKDQVDAAGTPAALANAQALQAPKQWSDWLGTMFNEADETGLSDSQIMSTGDNKRDQIPPLAEYKMPGLRGDIISSDGTIYATTVSEKNLVVGWPAADEAGEDADIVHWMRSRLAEVEEVLDTKIPVNDNDLLTLYRTQRYQPFMVMENLTQAQVDKIKSAGLEGKGFGFQTAPLRSYPLGSELSHVLGYLARDQQRNRGKYLAGDVIYDRYKGATGLESVLNADLAGKDGRFMISTTPEGYARSAVVNTPATWGNTARLSIDSRIQDAVEKAMANSPKKIKAAVMMDVHTGDIVAMASHPTFDPNVFVPTVSADEWKVVNENEFLPMLDRTIHAQYPPGSGFKTVTSIAAMDAGVFDPNWVVHCTGAFDLGSMHMDLRSEHGDVTYLEALTHSYNTYFATLGLKIGRDVLLDTIRSLNFGSLTGIDLPGELPGFIPDPESVKRLHNRDFGMAGGDVALTAIGQGDVLVTPVQMADFMACLANDGTIYRPRLIKQIEDRSGAVVRTYPVQTLRTVTFDEKWMPNLKEAMINVIDAGTATVVHRDDMKIAAKTGTAQVGTHEHRRQIAWLSGYLPADNPQYSFSIVIEGQFSDNHDDTEDGGLLGGRECGAIAKDIFDIIYPVPGKKAKEPAPSAPSGPKHYDDYSVIATAAPVAPDAPEKAAADAPVKTVPVKVPVKAVPVKAVPVNPAGATEKP